MIEAPVRNFLRALRRAIRQVRLYPAGHPLTEEAIKDSGRAVEELTEFEGEIVITLHEDAFYLNRSLLPHTSLEFNGLLREMQDRAIDSVTVIRPVSREDMYDLANFIAGEGDDLPAGGTVRLNERSVGFSELEVSPMSKLRRSYAGSLDALRAISGSLATDSGFELGRVVSAVEGIFEHSISHSGAALLLSTVKSHDEYTFYHSVNTCILSLAMGRLVGLEKEQLLPIGVGALLHDIGKVAVSARVLQSPGRLNEEQWKEIQLHPQEGAQAIMAAAGVGHEISATIAFEHHARFDGKGYPTVTRAGKPHVFSRLVSVADTYDAVTTRRSYRRAETPNRALNVLLNGAGSNYDPDLVTGFIQMMGVYPPGSILVLSGGETVMVTRQLDDGDRKLQGVMVKSATGELIEPEPVVLDTAAVVDQILPDRAGIDPAALLERIGVQDSLH